MPPDPPTADAVLLATQQWLERAVIGLGLCPFAKAVHVKGQIRFCVSPAVTAEALLEELRREASALADADPALLETTLLIAPYELGEFLDYNAFGRATRALDALGLTGTLQLASFHPDYEFGDSDSSDVANCSNRSPYPIATLRALGHDGWLRVLAGG